MTKINEKYLSNPYSKTGRALIQNATHTIEETFTINGEKLEYNKYVFADGSAVVECGAILDTEKDFLSMQSYYVRDCEDIEYEGELMPDNSHYEGEWLPYRSPNRY